MAKRINQFVGNLGIPKGTQTKLFFSNSIFFPTGNTVLFSCIFNCKCFICIFVIYIIDSFLIRFVCSGVIGWNKYKSSQFKILNNADTTYHNMSPFPTSFPLERGQEESRIVEGESNVAPAVARSLKNIRQESTESRSTLQSCVVDERGRTILKV